MRWIASLLAVSLATQPAFAGGRVVAVKSVGNGSIQGPVAGALQNPLGNASLQLTAPGLGLSNSLPILSPGIALPRTVLPVVAAAPITVNAADAPRKGKAGAPREVLRKKLTAIGRAVQEAGKDNEDAPAEQQADAARQQFDALGGVAAEEESFGQLVDQTFIDLEAGRLAPEGSFGASEILRNDMPRIGKALQATVKREGEAIVRGVEDAVATVFSGETIRVVSRGSSARATYEDKFPDHDLMVELPSGWTRARVKEEMTARTPAIREALERSLLASTALLGYSGLRVSVGGKIQLSDPATRSVDEGVYMLPVQVFDANHQPVLDIDVTFTNRRKYTNDYPGYFADQLRHVSQIGGQEAVGTVLSSIRLAKGFFKQVVGAYKVWRGGPSGVGVEQMIMQSGVVDNADKGRTISEIGDFDKFIDRIHAAAFTESGLARTPAEAKAEWVVYNPFRAPANFVEHISDRAWRRLATAARAYRNAKGMGRPTSFAELAQARRTPIVMKAEAEIPVRKTVALTLEFSTRMDRRAVDRALRDTARDMDAGGDQVLDIQALNVGPRAQGNREYRVNLLVASEASVEEISDRLKGAFHIVDVTAEETKEQSREIILFLRQHIRVKSHRERLQLDKNIRRLGKRLRGRARVRLAPRSIASQEPVVRLTLETGADAVSIAEDAEEFFKQRGGTGIVAVSLPKSRDAEAPPAAVEDGAPGAMTLEMLENFTEEGAARPGERGDAYLYAQGAKVLAPGLEASWQGRTAGSRSGKPERTERLLLRRQGGRTQVLLPSVRDNGRPFTQFVTVPDYLANGIVTDTLVEVGFRGRNIVSVESIGAYPMDVMIGRVVRQDGQLKIEALLKEEGKAKALYPRMPLTGEVAYKEGDLIQVFVKPQDRGFEAEVLMNLGSTLTPEIAAREIALRHGARGYFDEDVIRQAEEVGRMQDPSADFKAVAAKMAVDAPDFKISNMTDKPFVTIDPVGAGDLDDAYYVERHQDGSYTWYLATADVGHYVTPGTPAFRAAALIGNTFYSVDKNGVGEYPMNHPVVSKYVSSLLAGKESLAMITKMEFSQDGTFLEDQSEVSFGLVNVQGRYTYDQVVQLWKGNQDHGITHLKQVELARELARKLDAKDAIRGKLDLQFEEVAHRRNADGSWTTEVVEEDPLASESHKLIEELKVYGNRGIAGILEKISSEFGIPHISRVHPEPNKFKNKMLRKELSRLGIPWPKNEELWDFLKRINNREDLTPEGRETAQILALRTRSSAQYGVEDGEGHEGLALEAGQYDHPSAPIRRFADMYNRALLEEYLSGGNPRDIFEAVETDLRTLGFKDLKEYMQHLNGREKASKSMDREMDNFMSFYELAKPEHHGKTFKGYVKVAIEGKFSMAVIQLTDIPVSFTLTGDEAQGYRVMDGVSVLVKGADPKNMKVDARITRDGKRLVLLKSR